MQVRVCSSAKEIGIEAARQGASIISRAVRRRGCADIVLATGVSQFAVLENLVQASDVEWSKVCGFHLDEYVGLAASHPASFRRYLRERFVDRVPIGEFHYINAEGDPRTECKRLGRLIKNHPVDVAFVGIGENGHLAFNDPPADFDTRDAYIVVELDEKCRMQQVGEGWFKSIDEVPRLAVSMSIAQIMKAGHIICSCPEKRKAPAVKRCLEGLVSNLAPASVLQTHEHAMVYLDPESASLLEKKY